MGQCDGLLVSVHAFLLSFHPIITLLIIKDTPKIGLEIEEINIKSKILLSILWHVSY